MFNLNFSERSKELMTNISVMFMIFISGIIFSISYFVMNKIHVAFLSVDCLIPQNTLVTTCQEWFALALFPILQLKELLIFANYFAIFGMVFGLFFMGFRTKKHPALLVVHIITSIIVGYLSIHIGNIYRVLLQNPAMYEILTPFVIYNKIMLYFPQFIFFVIFLSGIIGFFGIFKSVGQFNEGAEDLG
jgi:hypothetical protein